jgi:hypothetical protein
MISAQSLASRQQKGCPVGPHITITGISHPGHGVAFSRSEESPLYDYGKVSTRQASPPICEESTCCTRDSRLENLDAAGTLPAERRKSFARSLRIPALDTDAVSAR